MNENQKEISSAKLMWKMTRPHTLTATFAPVILGTVISIVQYTNRLAVICCDDDCVSRITNCDKFI